MDRRIEGPPYRRKFASTRSLPPPSLRRAMPAPAREFSNDLEDMMTSPKPIGYSTLQIALHWTIAALVAFQLIFGESMTAVVDALSENETPSPTDQQLASLHYWFGLAVLFLVAVRLALRLVRGAPPSVGVSSLAAKSADLAHALFYLLLIAVPITGLLGYYVGDPWGDLHTWGKPAFIILIAIHATAALFHQFWVKDGTLRRMLVTNAS